jgi:hypothetical protein
MAAREDQVTVTVTLDAELVDRARAELGVAGAGDRAVVERVLNAYLMGRQSGAMQGRAGLSEQEAERLAYEQLNAARRAPRARCA